MIWKLDWKLIWKTNRHPGKCKIATGNRTKAGWMNDAFISGALRPAGSSSSLFCHVNTNMLFVACCPREFTLSRYSANSPRSSWWEDTESFDLGGL